MIDIYRIHSQLYIFYNYLDYIILLYFVEVLFIFFLYTHYIIVCLYLLTQDVINFLLITIIVVCEIFVTYL